MAFRQVADLDCDSATALGGVNKKTGKKNPTSIEGYFIGSREVDSPKSKTGKAALHVIQTSKGNVGVWGKTNLDMKMKAATPGQMVRITFAGMVPTKNNPMYKYNVEVDEENTIEVSAADSGVTQGDESEETDSEGGGEGAGYESEDRLDEQEEAAPDEEEQAPDEQPAARAQPPRKPAQAPSAARQAQVQALLKKGKAA